MNIDQTGSTQMDMRQLLAQTYHAALRAVSPATLLAPHLQGPPPDQILAFGKAALPMARAALAAYPGTPTLIIAPQGTSNTAVPAEATVMLSAHPVPDESSVLAAEEALRRVAALTEGQEVLVLVSGGGSALLCAPHGVSLAQKQALTQELLKAGADIHEINLVRQHLSRVKGGRLAQATRARVRALLISDVIGDDPSVIASGPTVPARTGAGSNRAAEALAVLDRYSLRAPAARAHLEEGGPGTPQSSQEPLSQEPRPLPKVHNTVIGSNRLLLEAARAHLEARGLPAVILGDTFDGEARELARGHAAMARSIQRYGSPWAAPVALLSGGECTVTVRGNGVGGRNQEFALWLLDALGGAAPGLYALSAGSDGIDGSSEAAGAFLTPDSWARAQAAGLSVRDHLARNDSGTFFATLGDALVTGPSGHNLNDLRILVVGFDGPGHETSGESRQGAV